MPEQTAEKAPADQCYGCWWHGLPYKMRGPGFVDERTNRRFCGECLMAMLSWEMDAHDSIDPDLAEQFAEWAGEQSGREGQ